MFFSVLSKRSNKSKDTMKEHSSTHAKKDGKMMNHNEMEFSNDLEEEIDQNEDEEEQSENDEFDYEEVPQVSMEDFLMKWANLDNRSN